MTLAAWPRCLLKTHSLSSRQNLPMVTLSMGTSHRLHTTPSGLTGRGLQVPDKAFKFKFWLLCKRRRRAAMNQRPCRVPGNEDVMNYLIRLMDNEEFPAEQRRLIEQRYDQALVQQLGSPEQVAQARRAWVQAKTREDEATGSDLSLEEKRAIVCWERAEAAARLLAFEGYTGALEELYIDVRLAPVP